MRAACTGVGAPRRRIHSILGEVLFVQTTVPTLRSRAASGAARNTRSVSQVGRLRFHKLETGPVPSRSATVAAVAAGADGCVAR